MNRRGFLKGMAGILAAGVAPIALPSTSIMRVRPIALLTETARASGMYMTIMTQAGPLTKFVSNTLFAPPTGGVLYLPTVTFDTRAGDIVYGGSMEIVRDGEVMATQKINMRGPEVFPSAGVFAVNSEIGGEGSYGLTPAAREQMIKAIAGI